MEDRPPKEAELVRRAKHGELDAYEEIVRMHGTVAFRIREFAPRRDLELYGVTCHPGGFLQRRGPLSHSS